jgi:tetratricopeptide (TPR) repeat protein
VRGRPLADAIAEYQRSPSPLGLHDLLRPFVAACYEMAYAHGRGLGHLGLTPRLILLGEFGETAVAGWDSARPYAGGNGEPAMIAPGGDPYAAGFLAPEQALGQADLVGPASDVYALGAILYAMLTGQPPHSGATTAEVLTRVRAGLPWQPRMVAAHVPIALEAVCLTAMERQPADRYASASELARELERWMAGQPVHTNYVEPRTARLARWARNKIGLWAFAALSVLLISALASLAVAVYVIRTERAQLDPALHENERLRGHLNEVTTGLHQSKQYVDAVNHERAVASEELAAAAQALQVLALKAQHRPDDPAAAYKSDLLRTILGATRQIAQRLELSGGTDLAVARARAELGDVFLALGQRPEARYQYERAVAIDRAMAKTRPSEVPVLDQLVRAARSLGQLCLLEQQPAFAANLALEAHAAAEAWSKIEPGRMGPRREAFFALALLADACAALHDWPAARQAFEKMAATVEGYAGADPSQVLAQIDKAECAIGRGRLEQLDYRYKDALSWYEQGVAILQPLEADGKLKAFPQLAGRLSQAKASADECRSILRAIDDIKAALDQPKERAVHLLVGRSAGLARLGRPAEAAATAERLRQLAPQDGINLYNVACCYGLCATAVVAGKADDALSADDKAGRARYLAQALKDLRAAASHGFRDVAKIESDPDLDPLRQDGAYRALVAELKAMHSWLRCPVLF